MSDQRPEVDYERLNLLGKSVFLTGQVARVATSVIEFALDRAVDVLSEAEKAFRHGLSDDDVEDAKILEEHRRDEPGS